MKTLFKTSIAIAALAAFTTGANAGETINPFTSDLMGAMMFESEPDMVFDTLETRPANIGIARLDNGRLISVPHTETEDWHFLNKRTKASFETITAAAYLRNVPEIAYGKTDSTNKIDEIRMTALDAGQDYVVVYSLGRDAEWSHLGGQALAVSEHIAPSSSAEYRNASGKAVVLNTYTGKILGTVMSNETEFGVGDLTDRIQELTQNLTVTVQPEV